VRRPVSPLLHDYKPLADRREPRIKPWHWFAAGLGLPIAAVAAVLGLGGDAKTEGPAPGSAIPAPASLDLELETLYAGDEPFDLSPPVATDAMLRPAPATGFHPPLALPPEPAHTVLTHEIRSGDTLERLFRRNGISLGDLARIASLDKAGRHLRILKPGDVLEIHHDEGRLLRLSRTLSLTEGLEITRDETGFAAELVERPIEVRRRRAYGRIETSLFESAAAAGLPDKLIMNLAGIFAWDIDFVLDIRRSDDYYILYEEIWQNGEFVTTGEIVAAEFNNNGRTFQAIRFVDPDGRSDYFTPEGRSVRKAFLRAPVDFTRISSNFNPRRRHPILNTIRAHKGVDYAAPQGTPIRAAGDGKVIHRGRKGGYGNAVILQHGGNITTLYAHMSSFARGAPLGSRVKQGQTIGFVGSTGLATAAHLHYEYRLNGVHRNPRTVQLPQAEPIRQEYRGAFLAAARPLLDELTTYKRTQVAAAAFE